jgi:hypothetical protein
LTTPNQADQNTASAYCSHQLAYFAHQLSLEREIKELDRSIKETRTLSKGAATLAEKLTAQKSQRDLEALRDRIRRELFDRQDEIQAKHDGLIDELEKQLKQVTATRLFAVEWEVS